MRFYFIKDIQLWYRDKKIDFLSWKSSLEDDFYLRAFCCLSAGLFLIACWSLKSHHDKVRSNPDFFINQRK